MAGRFEHSLVVRIQQACDIVDVVGEHLSLVKKGKDLVGMCPFHNDHRPSMYVSPSKQIFKCFACGVGGDVIKFVQMRENLGFGQAVERLANRAGIKIEKQVVQRAAGEADPEMILRANEWAARLFAGGLWDEQKGADARNYIAQRQIRSDMAKKWQLGLAIDSWDELCKAAAARKISPRLLEQAGLAVARESGQFYDKFRNRLMFPIWDATGKVIAFGGRALGTDPAKYMNSPTTAVFDKSNSLYGLHFARHSIVAKDLAVVVEGYMDCLMSHQFGVENVVATLGTSLTAGHARILRRYARKIVLVFDSDVAGMEAANRSLEVFLSEGIDIRIASVPQGKDPCDFLLAAGKEAFENVINNAVDVMEYKWSRLLDGFERSDTIAGQKAAAEEFLNTAAAAINAGKIDTVSRGLIIGRLGRVLGLTTAQVNGELAKRIKKVAEKGSYFAVENQKVVSVDLGEGFYAKAQREMLEVLLNEPKLVECCGQKITVDMFEVPILRHIALKVLELVASGGDAGVSAVLAGCESVEEGQVVVQLVAAGEAKGNFKERLAEALGAINDHRLKADRHNIDGDDDEALRSFGKKVAKTNLRNVGL